MTNAVRFSASTMKYSRSATGLGASDFTYCCWVKIVVDRNAFGAAIAIDNAGSAYHNMGVNGTGTQMVTFTDGGDTTGGLADMTVGSWYFMAHCFSTGSADANYYAAAGASTLTTATVPGGNAVADTSTFYLGSDGFNDWINGSIAAVKVWTAVLSKTELEAEMASYAAVRTANLWANYKFDAGPSTADSSGNARTLTQTGTPTLDSSGPPIGGGGGTSYALTATGTGTSTGSLAVGGLPTDLTGTGTGTTVGSLAVNASSVIAATGTGASTGSLAVTITSGPGSLALASTGHGTTTGHLAVIRAGVGGGGGGGGTSTSGRAPGGYQPRNTPAERRAFFDHKRQLAQLEARIEALETP